MSEYSQAQVGRRLRDERKARGLRQFDVAEALGVTNDTVCAWETGRKNMKAKNLFEYLMFLSDQSDADDRMLSMDDVCNFRPYRMQIADSTVYVNAAERVQLDFLGQEEEDYEKELG